MNIMVTINKINIPNNFGKPIEVNYEKIENKIYQFDISGIGISKYITQYNEEIYGEIYYSINKAILDGLKPFYIQNYGMYISIEEIDLNGLIMLEFSVTIIAECKFEHLIDTNAFSLGTYTAKSIIKI